MKKVNILILGEGRTGKAIEYYLKKINGINKISFFNNEENIKGSDILIGALAGEIGEKSLYLALKYKKNLIDISDIEPEFYFKKKKKIIKSGIIVIPCCGFSPGLLNFILGREIIDNKNIKEIKVKAGTLSLKNFFFPFLWCFEDLIFGHNSSSKQKISNKIKNFLPFEGYEKEKLFGIEAESYFSQSGFDNLIYSFPVETFKYKIIRPLGFIYFFQFLKNQGFLNKDNFKRTKEILEKNKEDNLTIAEIKILSKDKEINWQIKSFSKKTEKFNSMQKITSIMPAIIVGKLIENKIKDNGLIFVEELSKDENLFKEIIKEIKKIGKILIKRR